MGTRADFYIGRGEKAEWLGSIAFDGYPDGISKDKSVFNIASESGFRELVAQILQSRNDATLPSQGWPWPWEDSRTTDYAYAFDQGKIWASNFGYEWFDPLQEEPEDSLKTAVFPDMRARQKVALGPRSGLIIIHTKTPDQ